MMGNGRRDKPGQAVWLERDDFSSNRHPALSFCLTMISAQTPGVCREGKPVSTLPDHALIASPRRMKNMMQVIVIK
jgi:hypothetical protein